MDERLKRRETIEVYSNLIGTEIKSLSARMSEISTEVASFAQNFNAVLLQIEDLNGRIESMQTGLGFCRSELSDIKKMLAEQERRFSDT